MFFNFLIRKIAETSLEEFPVSRCLERLSFFVVSALDLYAYLHKDFEPVHIFYFSGRKPLLWCLTIILFIKTEITGSEVTSKQLGAIAKTSKNIGENIVRQFHCNNERSMILDMPLVL